MKINQNQRNFKGGSENEKNSEQKDSLRAMESAPESSSEVKPSPSTGEYPSPIGHSAQMLGQTIMPWIDYAFQQARLHQQSVQETLDNTIEASRSRLSHIRSTSSAHFHQTLESLQEVKSELCAYEAIIFGKLKEGVHLASSHPLLTSGVATGLGFILLKRPRRFLYRRTLRLFMSEESLLSRADAKVKELKQTINQLKAESEKLEKLATHAEDEMTRGRTKLRQAGKQIQGVARSAYKIERQAAGLKDILGELPRREASRFQSQVSNLASEAKRERVSSTKEVTKISNYGISV